MKALPSIVLSQFCCTSLWFAGNGVMGDLVTTFGLAEAALGHLTSAVQFGFIAGTLVFAVLTITDRFSPSKVFMVSALLGALFNGLVIWDGHSLESLIGLRVLTGFFLAGIYPVGMKIAADYYDKGLGKSLGFLVGALVLGTAFPHLLKGFPSLPWRAVLLTTSSLAIIGGLLMVYLVPDGPNRKASQGVDLSAFFGVFKNREFRSAAFGYFGHMWELYAFWTFVPLMLSTYNAFNEAANLNVPLLSFLVIGSGGLACVAGGYLSERVGVKKVASGALLLSCICCLVSPLFFALGAKEVFLGFLFVWGMAVIADSPLFSTLVARNAPAEIKGTALTIVNCIGFAITIVSIQLVSGWVEEIGPSFIYTTLAVGPVFGLIALRETPSHAT
jgi:MFS family permease